MARILMFELLWNRMKTLRLLMVKHLDFSDPTLSSGQIDVKIMKLEEYLIVYRKLLDNLKYAGNASKLLFDQTYIIDAVLNITLPLVPAIFAELATVGVEKINLHLKRHLLVCPHNALRSRVCDALKFLELRPFRYTIWRAFSLNISLPLGLISLCTTYTIVLIQFSHVYG
ncbi:jg20523 [Pararge aegeria aegeria]|uniref:Jg20523 protein n=1 Tax=Pararge aegeria aegeria TaxID=348720 RepID=A0A8S4S7S7_9NEOP|nr:jg20523 [Pararge aegeria aegeria]